MEATLSSKGQATIPKAVRDRLHLKPGDRFKFFFHPDGVIILPKIPTSALKGMIPKPSKPGTGIRFSTSAVPSMNPRYARAEKK